MSTDIWAWVQDTHTALTEAGHHRLAWAIGEIATLAVEGRDEQLDALHPEALAAARELGLPWVEVFLRHWRLQNLLNKRHQGEAALGEAVALLEFAHREETAACPQSVCAVQDFTICHANIDGPGYVGERLEVLEETLARVEPGRACYDCLTRELADTLEDDARPAEALARLDRARTRIQAAGGSVSLAFGHSRASALRLLGRQAEALAAYDAAERAHTAAGQRLDEDDRRKLAVGRAQALAELGRYEPALALLPAPAEADRHPDIRHRWAATAETLATAGALPNDPGLGVRLVRWASYLDEAGSHRPCLDLLLVAARLAVARGARTVALALSDEGARKLTQLRSTTGVADRLAEVRAAALALPLPELPAEGPDPDPERGADLLAAARAQQPTEQLTVRLALLLSGLGLGRAARELLWERLAAEPGEEETALLLGELLIESRDADGVRRLAELQLGVSPADAHWTRARWAAAEGRWAEVGEHCAALLAEQPDAVSVRRLAARAAIHRGEYAEAQRLYQELLAQAGPDHTTQEPDLWQLAAVASANRDWAVAREAGARLGLTEDERQLVTVRARRTNGASIDLPALRTGPATARILPVLGEDVPLNHDDLVVFSPTPLAGADAVFELLTLLDPAGWTTYWLDGAWPGEASWLALREALQAAGLAVWLYSGSEYAVADPADPAATLPGLYAAIGLPPTAHAADADAELTRLTARWPHPLCWPDLAESAGADPAPHRAVAKRYGL